MVSPGSKFRGTIFLVNSSCWLLMAAGGTLVTPSPLEALPSGLVLGPQAARDMTIVAARITEIVFFIVFVCQRGNDLRWLLLSNFVFSVRQKQRV